MDKNYYKKFQPVFYQTIFNSIKSKKLNHAFLLTGDSVQIKDAALFLSQVILCESETMCCEVCTTCKRVNNNTYADLIILDGSKAMIKKDDIIRIQEEFKKTALEGKAKIYIIHCVDNCMPQTINSLLKMLEDPTDEIYAIFTTKNQEKVLDTIVSRCQIIRITTNNNEYIEKQLKGVIDSEDIKILSSIYNDVEQIKKVFNEGNYLDIKQILFKYLNNQNKGHIILYKELLTQYTEKEDIELFLNLVILFYRDILAINYQLPILFKKEKQLIDKHIEKESKIVERINIYAECKDQIDTNINLMLLFDKMFYSLGGV